MFLKKSNKWLEDQCRNCLLGEEGQYCPVRENQRRFNYIQEVNINFEQSLDLLINETRGCSVKTEIDAAIKREQNRGNALYKHIKKP